MATGSADEHSDIDIAILWPGEDAQEKAEENITSRVDELTGNACNLLHYTTEQYAALAERAPQLHAAIESEGIDLMEASARRWPRLPVPSEAQSSSN